MPLMNFYAIALSPSLPQAQWPRENARVSVCVCVCVALVLLLFCCYYLLFFCVYFFYWINDARVAPTELRALSFLRIWGQSDDPHISFVYCFCLFPALPVLLFVYIYTHRMGPIFFPIFYCFACCCNAERARSSENDKSTIMGVMGCHEWSDPPNTRRVTYAYHRYRYGIGRYLLNVPVSPTSSCSPEIYSDIRGNDLFSLDQFLELISAFSLQNNKISQFITEKWLYSLIGLNIFIIYIIYIWFTNINTQREIFKYIVLEIRTFVLETVLVYFDINVLNTRTKWWEEKR